MWGGQGIKFIRASRSWKRGRRRGIEDQSSWRLCDLVSPTDPEKRRKVNVFQEEETSEQLDADHCSADSPSSYCVLVARLMPC